MATSARPFLPLLLVTVGCLLSQAAPSEALPGGAPSTPLADHPDRSAEMVAGLHRFFDRLTATSVVQSERYRTEQAKAGMTTDQVRDRLRQQLRTLLGAVDPLPTVPNLAFVGGPDRPALVATGPAFTVHAVAWPAFARVHGEGLLLRPVSAPRARVVVLPDATQTPEQLAGLSELGAGHVAVARLLVEAGCEVLVPTLIDRESTFSGNPAIAMTDQSHREWVWRPNFEAGRTLTGLEVRKVEAALAWFRSRPGPALPIGVAGYGDGGRLALFLAALDPGITATVVSGAFQTREDLWREPIDRNIHGLLKAWGDAELARLAAPGILIIEASDGPTWSSPGPSLPGRKKTAAPGVLAAAPPAAARLEYSRARVPGLAPAGTPPGPIFLAEPRAGGPRGFGSTEACNRLLDALGLTSRPASPEGPVQVSVTADTQARQQRQVEELLLHAETLLHGSEDARAAFNQRPGTGDATTWAERSESLRETFWRDHVGRLPDPSLPMNPRSRLLERGPHYAAWEVVLDVWPDVFTWGILLVPNAIKEGERRPVVVCQHGLEGTPFSLLDTTPTSKDAQVYKAFPRQLAERGFVCYVPHNPYRGGESFRQLQRKANPLGLTLFSVVVGQHQRQLEWLGTLPFVDASRIGFYGLSYGGLSALRLPALLPGYAVSVCSGAFNTWSWKIMSRDYPNAYVFTHEYEQFSFNLANRFGNADLAALIAPRPFMVERGHQDPVGRDEWVSHEYAKVRRLYSDLGIPERTEMEFFPGRHEIHGVGTFAFLHRHLRWPEPAGAQP
ncbi:MAG: dienelactone hydrolase family protein [Opitutaceae bacterium]